MTRDLKIVGNKILGGLYGIVVGQQDKGGSMSESEAPGIDPRDARIAELEEQLNEAKSGTTADEPEAPAAPVEVSYDDAKAKVDAGQELTDADVTALERGPGK